MSISTPPPGSGPKNDGGARPTAGAAPFTSAGGVAGATGVTPTTPVAGIAPVTPTVGATLSPAAAALVQPGTLDGPGALRVLVEEIRAVVQAQLRSGSLPALPPPDTAADPGNAAAALLRWLRTAAAENGLPLARLSDAVETGHSRAATALAATPGGERLVRETLASARDVVLRGIASGGGDAARAAANALAGDARTARAPATATATAIATATGAGAAQGMRGADASGRVAPIDRDTRAPQPRGATPAADAAAGRASARAPVPAALAGELATRAGADVRTAVPGAAPPPRTSADMMRALGAAVRASPGDPPGALRRFAEELTSGAGTRGSAWLPPAEVDVVDPGASLVRWVRTAAALPGAAPDTLRATIANAHGRTVERLAAAPAAAALRDVVGLARDLLVGELDGPAPPSAPSSGTLPATTTVEPHANPAALRPELVIGGPPRAGRAHAGATRGRSDDRVDAVGAEERRREWERSGEDEEAAPAAARESRPLSDVDLQGPMDCIRRYFDAFHAGDSTAYAEQWVYPACFWSGGIWAAYADAAACIAGNAAHEAAAREQGMAGGRILMLRVEPLTPTVAIVHGVFTRERDDGSLLAEIEAAYTTVKTDGGWKVAVCVVK